MVWECDQDQGLQEKWPQWSLYWTWEALPPRVPGTGVSWTTLDQTLRSTTYTWMIKLEIAGCLQHAAQMKVFVSRCRGWQTAFMLDRGSVFCLPSSDRMYHQADVEVRG